MFRRRKRKDNTANGSLSESRLSNLAPTPAALSPIAPVHQKTTVSLLLTDEFMGAIERAADWPRKGFGSEGKTRPMVFFAHADGTMKAVYLSLKDEYHKESLIRRIREKAHAENAFAVILLTEMDGERNTFVCSGVSPGMKASACVEYGFDTESKTITSRTVNWLDQSIHNAFIDDIFDTT